MSCPGVERAIANEGNRVEARQRSSAVRAHLVSAPEIPLRAPLYKAAGEPLFCQEPSAYIWHRSGLNKMINSNAACSGFFWGLSPACSWCGRAWPDDSVGWTFQSPEAGGCSQVTKGSARGEGKEGESRVALHSSPTHYLHYFVLMNYYKIHCFEMKMCWVILVDLTNSIVIHMIKMQKYAVRCIIFCKLCSIT